MTYSSATAPVRSRLLLVLAALVAVALSFGTVGTAAASTPSTPDLGKTIEAYPKWISEQGCLAGVRPGVTATIEKILKPNYGGPSTDFLGQRACSASKESAHDDGKALDWMMSLRVPSEKANADNFIAWLLATDKYGNTHAMARRLGIMYIIWNNKMLRLYRISDGWQPYNTGGQSCLTLPATSYDTICHRDHVHVSFTPDGAYQRTSYWTAPVVPPVDPPVTPSSTLKISAPLALTTTVGGTVAAVGTTAKAGDVVQLYIRHSGTGGQWVAILSPITSSATARWAGTYTTSRTHELQVRSGSAVSNTVTVTVN